MVVTNEELDAVVRYLADTSKSLDGIQPDWQKTVRGDFQAVWPIVEFDKRVRSSLRFRIHPDERNFPSVSLVFRNKNISRFDRVRQSQCEPNPLSAAILGLPARVCGPHFHKWADNQSHVATSGKWELPVRRPVEDRANSLEKMFLWFCSEVNVRVSSEQRQFVEPPRDLLSDL